MLVIAVLLLQQTAPTPTSHPPALADPLRDMLPSRTRCSIADAGPDVVVCASRTDRHRLPLPIARSDPTERHRGDARTGLDALTPPIRCGIFAGERSCGKREAAAYGYENGRDPVTVLGKLVSKIADPDAN